MNDRKKDLQGWLKRKGGRMSTWPRRWCILSDKFLFMFSKEDDRKPTDCIDLDGRTITEPALDTNANEPKRYQFDILGGSDKNQIEIVSLCAETEELKKIWVRALKKAAYANKGGALFSQSLDEILMYERRENRIIPYIVDECVEFLYKYGLEAEGIFRLPGRQSSIKEIIARFDRGEKIKFEEENVDIHVVASVLKTFLRDLPDSIIPCRFFQKFMNIAMRFMESSDNDIKMKCVSELAEGMKEIPKDNYIILKYVCRFLREVGLREYVNKMSMMSIGTVFGYNIIRHIDKENSHLLMCTADLGQNLVFMLLEYFSTIFKLEYSDKGEIGNVIPTGDLLRMSRSIDTKLLFPANHNPSYFKELEGVNFSSASPLTPDSCSSSLSSLNIHDNNTSGIPNSSEAIFTSADLVEKKRSFHLSLSDSSETGTSQVSPVSPNTDKTDPPVPPKRKSRLQRNRFASEKIKPSTEFHVGEKFTGFSEEKTNTKLISSSSELITSEPEMEPPVLKGSLSIMNRAFVYDSVKSKTNGDGKSIQSPSDLQVQVDVLKEELSVQREKSRRQINALKEQLTVNQEKYDSRIEAIQNEFSLYKLKSESNLIAVKEEYNNTVAENKKLKERLKCYEIKYGAL
ncbi:Rho GTPase activating protein 24 [Bulinus truncatus]|nr:Rho GTPase activating protein 24 [Bulinus truncatus]